MVQRPISISIGCGGGSGATTASVRRGWSGATVAICPSPGRIRVVACRSRGSGPKVPCRVSAVETAPSTRVAGETGPHGGQFIRPVLVRENGSLLWEDR